jgi:hypothetical protein
MSSFRHSKLRLQRGQTLSIANESVEISQAFCRIEKMNDKDGSSPLLFFPKAKNNSAKLAGLLARPGFCTFPPFRQWH